MSGYPRPGLTQFADNSERRGKSGSHVRAASDQLFNGTRLRPSA